MLWNAASTLSFCDKVAAVCDGAHFRTVKRGFTVVKEVWRLPFGHRGDVDDGSSSDANRAKAKGHLHGAGHDGGRAQHSGRLLLTAAGEHPVLVSPLKKKAGPMSV